MEVLQRVKTDLSLDVKFAKKYQDPVVIVSPFWDSTKGDSGQLAYPSTITSISQDRCTITSGNQAGNYFVNIMVLERKPNPIVENTTILADSVLKRKSPKQTVSIKYNNTNQDDPVLLISSFWNGSDSGVKPIDTIDDLGKTEASIISSNEADNYYVNYAVVNRSMSTPSSKSTYGFQFQANTVNKTGTGRLRVYFARAFEKNPIVFISPWWNDENSPVLGNVPTITKITEEYFEVISNNAASNYFLHWLAIES